MGEFYKRTWHVTNDAEIQKIFNEVKDEAERLYPTLFQSCKPQLFVDSSKKHLGKCVTRYNRCYTKQEMTAAILNDSFAYEKAAILLSKYILHDLKKVRAVLIHELGHFVSPGESHSNLWKTRANAIGKKWNISNARLDESGVLKQGMESLGVEYGGAKYIIECPVCKKQYTYQRMCKYVRDPGRFRCNKRCAPLVRIK